MTASGFPHSDIHGSTLAYSSPWHFGVRPVLRRLLAPRHPPCALPTFTCFNGYPFMSVNSVGVLRYLVSKVHTVSREPQPFRDGSLKTKHADQRGYFLQFSL